MKRGIFLILFLLVFVIGCNQQAESEESQELQENTTGENADASGVVYQPYTKENYEKALSENKFVFLNFYANWCPICKRERPDIVNALKEISREDLVALEVNYNDDQTDENEKALAKKFGVTYQHTKVIVNSNEEELFRTLESLNRNELKEKIVNSLP
ncbi:redoxin domain-containing protein [Candidatus Woesearchaeota archaeon]|nr:redoxin domain-containing protein [Candidatus Woesearchaeota archaeon]